MRRRQIENEDLGCQRERECFGMKLEEMKWPLRGNLQHPNSIDQVKCLDYTSRFLSHKRLGMRRCRPLHLLFLQQ